MTRIKSLLTSVVAIAALASSVTAEEWDKTASGAKYWNENPISGERAFWSGGVDANGYVHGQGIMVWIVNDKPVQATIKQYEHGKRTGSTILLSSDFPEFAALLDENNQLVGRAYREENSSASPKTLVGALWRSVYRYSNGSNVDTCEYRFFADGTVKGKHRSQVGRFIDATPVITGRWELDGDIVTIRGRSQTENFESSFTDQLTVSEDWTSLQDNDQRFRAPYVRQVDRCPPLGYPASQAATYSLLRDHLPPHTTSAAS